VRLLFFKLYFALVQRTANMHETGERKKKLYIDEQNHFFGFKVFKAVVLRFKKKTIGINYNNNDVRCKIFLNMMTPNNWYSNFFNDLNDEKYTNA